MTLQNLADNIRKQQKLIREITYYNDYLSAKLSEIPERREFEKDLFNKTIESLTKQLRIINSAIPELLDHLRLSKKLPTSNKEGQKDEAKNLVKLETKKADSHESVTLKKEDKEKYVKELRISAELIQKLKGRIEKKPISGGISLQSPSIYGKVSNYFFRNTSRRLIEKGSFRDLSINLRKSNSPFIINTYISIMFFSLSIMLLLSLITGVFLYGQGWLGEGLAAIMKIIGIIAGVELTTFLIVYYSPAMDVSATARKINQELPFVTVHMAAIAGSGIEPSRIFSIIVASEEYPHTRKELIKVINQTNYYGYDLVNGLRNVAKGTASEKLSELLKGLAVTISSGGSLESFLSKRAETLLLDYRLDREKYTKIAENFMNIYIALVIAAPMIFLLLLILIGISGTGLNYTAAQLSLIIISAVVMINIVFIIILNAKQPTY
jgi:pilus assembly protein TadC